MVASVRGRVNFFGQQALLWVQILQQTKAWDEATQVMEQGA
jgi:hypothetical protein